MSLNAQKLNESALKTGLPPKKYLKNKIGFKATPINAFSVLRPGGVNSHRPVVGHSHELKNKIGFKATPVKDCIVLRPGGVNSHG